jgi:hypothetical protein
MQCRKRNAGAIVTYMSWSMRLRIKLWRAVTTLCGQWRRCEGESGAPSFSQSEAVEVARPQGWPYDRLGGVISEPGHIIPSRHQYHAFRVAPALLHIALTTRLVVVACRTIVASHLFWI